MDRDLKVRTKDFAIRINRLYAALPKTTEVQLASLCDEAKELTAIFVTIAKVKSRK
jgi:hypothetical protein